MPTVDYCQHGPGCPEHTIRADYPETPETAELREVYETQGGEAMGACHKRQQHNRQRRSMNTARKRYAAVAGSPAGNWPLTTGNSLDSSMPTVVHRQHGPGCPEHTIRADYPETAELAELRDVYATQGSEAAGRAAPQGQETVTQVAKKQPCWVARNKRSEFPGTTYLRELKGSNSNGQT
jgi:hypothetical protein